MSKPDLWFNFIRKDVDRAESCLNTENEAAVHYYLSRIASYIEMIRIEIQEKTIIPGESPDKE